METIQVFRRIFVDWYENKYFTSGGSHKNNVMYKIKINPIFKTDRVNIFYLLYTLTIRNKNPEESSPTRYKCTSESMDNIFYCREK
jgi:hypothetical protein